MEQLKKYCLEIRCIDGLDTYIISPEFYEQILCDREGRIPFDISLNQPNRETVAAMSLNHQRPLYKSLYIQCQIADGQAHYNFSCEPVLKKMKIGFPSELWVFFVLLFLRKKLAVR